MLKKINKVKIALLTAGRSDYSIYLPLIKKLAGVKHFNLQIIAFGSHPYEKFGKSIDFIEKDGYRAKYIIKALQTEFSAKSISLSMGNTIKKFAQIYQKERYDLILALGDRFEMFAAVSASVPFNIPVAHLYGGEKTLGSIDEKFRHSITLMSKYHFTSTKSHAKKVAKLNDSDEHVYNVGALALDNIKNMRLLSIADLKEELKVDFTKPTLLATLHPETVNLAVNSQLVNAFLKAVDASGYQTLVTLPNNDTENHHIRSEILKLSKKKGNIFHFNALGPLRYFSCMKYCYAVIGNSSSGIVEAASFGKYFINIGDRQKGRDRGKNVLDVIADAKMIKQKIYEINNLPKLSNTNIYGDGRTADRIISILENELR